MEGGVAAGIRRVEAITGDNAVRFVQDLDARITAAAAVLKAQPSELTQRITQVQEQVKQLEKELSALKSKMASSQGDELAGQAIEVSGVQVLAATLEGADVKTLRETVDKLKDKLKSAAIVLASVEGGKVSLIAGVTADASNIAVHDLPDIGVIETLLVWRRGHFSSALNALKQTLVAQESAGVVTAEVVAGAGSDADPGVRAGVSPGVA